MHRKVDPSRFGAKPSQAKRAKSRIDRRFILAYARESQLNALKQQRFGPLIHTSPLRRLIISRIGVNPLHQGFSLSKWCGNPHHVNGNRQSAQQVHRLIEPLLIITGFVRKHDEYYVPLIPIAETAVPHRCRMKGGKHQLDA
jgi:hypothetical protein